MVLFFQRSLTVLLLLFILKVTPIYAQFGFLNPQLERDSTFIKGYKNIIIGSVYTQQRHAAFTLPASQRFYNLKYQTNPKTTFGIGFLYRVINVNFGIGIANITERNRRAGPSKNFDLNLKILGRKIMYDVYGIADKGFHSTRKDLMLNQVKYYYRDDVALRLFGGAAHFVFNPKKFTFRMGLAHDEWQHQSSGTFVASFKMFYGLNYCDSNKTLVPTELANKFINPNIYRMRFLNFGPSVGYAYHWVLTKHLFLSAYANAGINGSFSKSKSLSTAQTKFDITPCFLYWVEAGYNSTKWTVTATALGNQTVYANPNYGSNPIVSTGMVRLSLARRFTYGKSIAKILKPIDYLLKDNLFKKTSIDVD